MVTEDSNAPTAKPTPFASVAALKSAHGELLKRYHQGLGNRSVHGEDSQVLLSLLPEISDFLARGRMTGRLIDVEDDRVASQTYLDYWMNVIYRAGLTRDYDLHSDATLDEFNSELAPAIPENLCPYIGLDAFQEENKSIFYGRKKLVAEMVSKLQTERLLAVVGPSGSGKSSVVLAGLLPELKASALSGSETWNYCPPVVPGTNPLRSLALAVRPDDQRGDWVNREVALFERDGNHLANLFEQTSSQPSVLIIDQFEEVFTLCRDEQLRDAFINNLLTAATTEKAQHRIVITMRIDYQERMPSLERFYPLFLQGLVQVLPLSATDLRDAIEKPAAEVNLRFEQGIVDNLVKEIVGEPAGLPLLQFTLLELWRRRRRNRVLFDDYARLGGVRKALTNVASAVYSALSVQDQVIAKRIFLRLAWAENNPEVLRNRVIRKDLQAAGGSYDQVDAVLKKLVAARLIRLTKDEFAVEDKESPNDQFEVTHEALIRNWEMLVDWLQVAHETLRHRIRVRAAAEQWISHKRDPGGLLGGSLLVDAAKYSDLNDLEIEFIEASHRAEEAQKHEREAIHLREIEQLQELNAHKTRTAKVQRWSLAVLSVFLLFTAGAAIYAFRKHNQAVLSMESARSSQQKATDEAMRASDEALKAEAEKRKAEEERLRAQTQKDLADRLKVIAEQKAALASQKEADAKQAQLIAVAARDDAITSEKKAQAALDQTKKINAELKVARDDLTIKNAKLIDETKSKDEAIKRAEENYLTSVYAQNNLTRSLRKLQEEADQAETALLSTTSFSSDSTKLLTFLPVGNPRIWDTSSGQILRDGSEYVVAAALSLDGKRLTTAGIFGDISVKDVASDSTLLQFESDSFPDKLILSPDSQKLVILDNSLPGVKLYDLKTRTKIAELKTTSGVVAVTFSPDSKKIVLSNRDGEMSLASIGADNRVFTRTLGSSAGGCRESSIDLLNFSPSRDLRASLRVETKCQNESGIPDTVTAERVEEIGKCGLNPKPPENLIGSLKSGTGTTNGLKSSAGSHAKPTQKKSSEMNQGRIVSLVVTVYRKNDEDPFDFPLSCEKYTASRQEVIKAFETLASKGISAEDVRDISNAINDLAKKFSEIPGSDTDSTKTAKLQQLTTNLLWEIVDELNIPKPTTGRKSVSEREPTCNYTSATGFTKRSAGADPQITQPVSRSVFECELDKCVISMKTQFFGRCGYGEFYRAATDTNLVRDVLARLCS